MWCTLGNSLSDQETHTSASDCCVLWEIPLVCVFSLLAAVSLSEHEHI